MRTYGGLVNIGQQATPPDGGMEGRAMRREASTLDPICLRCLVPMALTMAGCPLLPRRFVAECPRCGRTVAITLTARVLRAGPRAGRIIDPHPPACQNAGPPTHTRGVTH